MTLSSITLHAEQSNHFAALEKHVLRKQLSIVCLPITVRMTTALVITIWC